MYRLFSIVIFFLYCNPELEILHNFFFSLWPCCRFCPMCKPTFYSTASHVVLVTVTTNSANVGVVGDGGGRREGGEKGKKGKEGEGR